MSLLKEFKSFVSRGNVFDLAVGVVIGGAFGKIVASLVNDVILPPIGALMSGVNFKELKWVLRPASEGRPDVAFAYGSFLQTTLEFVIIAACVFLLVHLMRRLRLVPVEKEAPPKEPSAETKLLEEIRDILKRRM